MKNKAKEPEIKVKSQVVVVGEEGTKYNGLQGLVIWKDANMARVKFLTSEALFALDNLRLV